MRSGVHEDDKRVIKSGRQSRSERGGEASEGVVGYMDVEGGNRGKAVSIVTQRVSSLGVREKKVGYQCE